MRIAVDTNVLVYAEGVNGADYHARTLALLEGIRGNDLVVPAQVLAETFNVLTKKAGFLRQRARGAVSEWARLLQVMPTSVDALHIGLDLAAAHHLNVFDAIILAVADAAGCRLLLSEDMQHGFEWRGVTVIDPFLPEPHPLLRRAVGG